MKSFSLNKIAFILLFFSVSFSSCRKFLDINQNPNLPQQASVQLQLPYAEAAIGHVLGNPLQIYGGIWAQYWTQNPFSSQYRSLENYSISTTGFDRPWRMLYADALEDLQGIQNKAAADPGLSQYAAIATILKAYAFQLATDAFGDIPLSQALDPNVTSPEYNTQEEVYDSIFSLINQGIGMIDTANQNVPTQEDLIFNGDMNQWLRFGNTLKLRALLRISGVAPQKAMTGISQLNGAQFLETDAQINYTTTGGNQNPLFSEMLVLGRTQNVVASETITKFLTQNRDPRADVFFERFVNDEMDTIVGIPQGSYRTTTDVFSIPSPAVGANGLNDQSAQAPVKFISAAESYFLQAEAVARGWLTTGESAEDLFVKGIRSSFASYNVPGVEEYLASSPAAQFPSGTEQQIKAIITQKWAAMTGNQSFEAWTEWRRTGFPDFFTVSEATSLGDERMPARLLYPTSEVTRNVHFETFPGLKKVYEPMWWDVND
jgi:hypothetical protein